jgi:UDP-N-acetylmuramoyl-L-alanyl-D-glutamate--2,6-diaminopimelate ligase
MIRMDIYLETRVIIRKRPMGWQKLKNLMIYMISGIIKTPLISSSFMQLKHLFRNIPKILIKGSKDVKITGICSNSKLAGPGNLFIAKKGCSDDGARYIAESISAGAAAVLTDLYDPSLKVTQVIHPKVAEIESGLAHEYYQMPSHELFMVGITGTNGKTTTSFITKFLLDKLDGLSGLIGTIEYIIGNVRYQATRTTPDVVTNHKMLRDMIKHGCRSAVMEVSSHALDQGRVDKIAYDIALFTNLSLDHLDYHSSMEAYCQAKQKLFLSLGSPHSNKNGKKSPVAIVNKDSLWTEPLLQGYQGNLFTFALDSQADLQASNLELDAAGSRFDVLYKGQKYPAATVLIGRYNVYNCLGAVSVLLAKGYEIEKILIALKQFASVPGRLEPVKNTLGLKIYVDFAHSEDALLNVLQCLQEVKQGKIITVFGCGGDRDTAKRPKMGAVAESYSDIVIVTADNPRSEDPEKICADIFKGFQHKNKPILEIDRYKALEQAIQMAAPDDIILIAGKGHEPHQIFAHKIVEFDDRKVATAICEKLCS